MSRRVKESQSEEDSLPVSAIPAVAEKRVECRHWKKAKEKSRAAIFLTELLPRTG